MRGVVGQGGVGAAPSAAVEGVVVVVVVVVGVEVSNVKEEAGRVAGALQDDKQGIERMAFNLPNMCEKHEVRHKN